MSLKEADRYAVIAQVIERTMGQSDAARWLNISVRQVKRLVRAIRQDARLQGQHLLQRGQALLGVVLLVEAEHGTEDDHEQDDDHVLDIANQQRQPGRDEQDHDQHALERVCQLESSRPLRPLYKPIGAVLREARLGFFDRQSVMAATATLRWQIRWQRSICAGPSFDQRHRHRRQVHDLLRH